MIKLKSLIMENHPRLVALQSELQDFIKELRKAKSESEKEYFKKMIRSAIQGIRRERKKTPHELDREEFLQHHYTGHIGSDAYRKYREVEGFSWLGQPSKYPILLQKKKYGDYDVEFRQSGEVLVYVKDRTDNGIITYMTPEEINQANLPKHDTTIVAFVGETPIGFASNEFGAVGVWVAGPFQRLGIGSDLMEKHIEQRPTFASRKGKIGQMTDTGVSMVKKYYDNMTKKHGAGWFRKLPTNESNDGLEENTFKMYHGGKRWTRIPTEIIATKKGRYEAGIGIYLTNNYETARRYGKGSRVVHLVYVDKNFKDISEVRIPLKEVITFLKGLAGLRHREEIILSITDIASRSDDNTIAAEILNNCVVNYELGNVGIKISNYLVSKGIDAHLQRQGNGEVWLIVFNPNIIKKVEVVNPAKVKSGFEFMLPKIVKENEEEDGEIDQNKLYSNESYLNDVAEKLGYDLDFNKAFWQYPQTLYHCTKQEHLPFIQQKGLLKRSDTRGINNSSVGSAVFTVVEDEIEHMKQYYGPVVIVINTKAMKADNYMPEVEREPDWDRAEKLAYVHNKLNPNKEKYPEQFIDSSDGVTQGTVIVYSNIPPKYLSVSE